MSYILEGLKKLEQKRRQEVKPPGLLSFREENRRRPKRPIIWPYLLFIALLLNAGIIVWWIGPWRSPGHSTLPKLTLPGQTAKPFTSKPVEFKNQSAVIPRKEPPPPKVVNTLSKSPALEKTKESISPVEKKSPASKSTPGTAPVSNESPSLSHKGVPEGPLLKLSDLPPEVKKNLPPLKMSVHFYSPDNQSRFVTINDRTLHEGETLSEGLRVVDINPAGTVLHYKGHRFLISVNENP
ncbi:MAG: general secretion pathway protein GspB [Deltaproteobacteria bacterium]|nr:general secretion pathway protein GspB [Deltaproteobacteria bacterium]